MGPGSFKKKKARKQSLEFAWIIKKWIEHEV